MSICTAMGRWLIWMCVGCLAATVAVPRLCAQNTNKHSTQNSAPVADRFVSTPGQMISTPGQMVTGPGQRVMGPGQVVIPPGQTVIPMGSSIAPTPGVIAPFEKLSSSSSNTVQSVNAGPSNTGVSAGRNYHNRRVYRPAYGAAVGYAVPYAVNDDYAAAEPASAPGAAAGRSMMAVPGAAALPAMAASAPSGNRPPYQPDESWQPEVPASAPNVIQTSEPVLTIVMKDGSRKDVRNYALTPQELIDLDGAGSGRDVDIPLSRINLPATEKSAAQAGLSFSVPVN